MKCPGCGSEMEEEIPRSKTGEPMSKRGVEQYKRANPRCIFCDRIR